MSGIAGIWHLDGRPVEQAALARMTGAMAHRGPDGVGLWTEGPVGLGHVALHTTPEALLERQPLVDPAAALALVLDGRVDNRGELGAALRSAGARLRSDGDAELVLRAYETWGEAGFGRILGDFALAIWDGRRRRLVCARDAIGIRPFHYWTDGRRVLWASELAGLLADPGVPAEPNEGMIAEHLANATTHVEETLYRGVRRLPPASVLRVGPDGARVVRYWSPEPRRTLRYRRDEEYAEHFAEVFGEAVRCRLRSPGPVGASLSGGLDSSAVVGQAQRLYRAGAARDAGFEAFALAFPGLPCDESRYVEDVARTWDLKCHLVPLEPLADADAAALSTVEQARQSRDLPDYPNGSMATPLMHLARARGFRVLLTGTGGDEWLTGCDSPYPELLHGLRLRALLREARAEAPGGRLGTAAALILRRGVWPLLPSPVQRGVRRALGRPALPRPWVRWIDPGLARRTALAERVRPPAPRPFASPAREYLLEALRSGQRVHFEEAMDRFAARFGIEERHPFHDRRLVELAFALPEEQRRRGDETKRVVRRVPGLLPESVRRRRDKAEFSHLAWRTWEAHGGAARFDALATARRGWVNQRAVSAMYREAAEVRAEGGTPNLWPLQMIFTVELWLRALESTGGGAAPRGRMTA